MQPNAQHVFSTSAGKSEKRKKPVDKRVKVKYNNFCVTSGVKRISFEKQNFRRNTQEAEEAPLLRV